MDHHPIHFGCVRYGSSEKMKWPTSNSNPCAQIQVSTWTLSFHRFSRHGSIRHFYRTMLESDRISYSNSDSDRSVTSQLIQQSICNSWSTAYNEAMSMVHLLSDSHAPSSIVQQVAKLQTKGVQTRRNLKGVRLCEEFTQYENLLHRTLFEGESVYGKRHRHDGVQFRSGDDIIIGLIEAEFAYYKLGLPAKISWC